MQNKQVIQKWINQSFCKHEWRSLGNMRVFTTHESGHPVQHIFDDLECVKCGKRVVESIRSPWCFP